MADLLALGAAFAAVAAAGAVAERLGSSVIPLYVLVGLAVGPNGLGQLGAPFVPVDETTTLLAELGIVLLLFFLGLEFSIERLLAERRQMALAGAVDAAVNFPLGVAIGFLLGWSAIEAFLLGGVVYISSSAIITKSLLDLGWIANPESEAMLGVLVFEDLVIAAYLALATPLVLGEGGLDAIAGDIGLAVAVLVALAVAAYTAEQWLDRLLATGSGEGLVLRTLAVAVPVAGVALALGVSEAVAAFFVGMAVAGTSHVERIEQLLAPVRDIFAAIFFLWIGLRTDPVLVAAVAGPLAVIVAVTAPAKLLSGYVGGRVYDLSERRSLRVGLGLVTRGEFSLVIAALAAAGTGPVMREVIPAVAVGYVLVMSTLGTVLMANADRVSRLLLDRGGDGGDGTAGTS
jgi:CPA2 family monovalent cation:H+ antiporter-2